MTVVDLSLTLAEELPCHWSTHQPFQHKVWNWFTSRTDGPSSVSDRLGPYSTRWMAIDEHTGTHFDAPSHFVPPPGSGLPNAHEIGSVTAEQVPPDQLMGPAVVLDVSSVDSSSPGVSPFITPDVVTGWESEHGSLAAGTVVLFRTGWDRHYKPGPEGAAYVHDVVVTGRTPGWPAPSVSTMELLLSRGIRCVGTDAPSMGAAHDGAPVHVCGLTGGAVYVECLTALDQLPATGAWFCFLPLKVRGGTGAPGRAVAFL